MPFRAPVITELMPGRPSPQAWPLNRVAPGVLQLPVVVTAPAPGAQLERLELHFSTSRFALRVGNATLSFANSTCRLEAGTGILWDDGVLHLAPVPGTCAALPEHTASAGMLEVRLLDHGTVSLVMTSDAQRVGLLRTDEGLAALGLWYSQSPEYSAGPVSRLQLLAAMWGARETGAGQGGVPGWALLGLLGAAAIVACCGMGVRRRWPGLCCGLCALGLAVAYAVIVPPFHAPDEPDHFLSWARQSGHTNLVADAEQLARTGHFQRIKSSHYERFGSQDLQRPYPVPWETLDAAGIEQVTDSRMESRSTLTTAFWGALQPLFSGTSAARALLQLRLANAVCFGLAVWLGAALLFRNAGGRVRPWFVYLVPTLPFFAMHVSNYAQFTSIGVVLACAGLVALLQEHATPGQAFRLGLWIGAAASLLVLSASTGLAVGAFLIALSVASAPSRWDSFLAIRRFWLGLTLGGLLLLAGTGTEQLGLIFRVLGTLMAVEASCAWWVVPAGIAAICATGAAVESLAARLCARPGNGTGHCLAKVGRLAAAALAIALAVLLLYSGFQHYAAHPQRSPQADLGRFVWCIVCEVPTLLTFRTPEVLLSQTFWGGFGWHEAMLPEWLVQFLAGCAGVGLVCLAWLAARQRQGLMGWRVCCWLAGCCGFLLTTGAAAAMAGAERGLPNIHGRYLLAVYAVLLAGAFAGWSLTVGRWARVSAVAPGSFRGQRFLEGWLLTGFALTLVLAVTRFSLAHVFLWLPIDWLHPVLAALFPVLGWWWLRLGAQTTSSTLNPAAGVCWGRLLAGSALLGLCVVWSELLYGLPWVFVRYPYGFFVILCFWGLVWLGVALRVVDMAETPAPRWSPAAATVLAHALHLGALCFLLHRYVG
ncbi:glycosyltransferase family protein [Megalodesulfovibrio paquesii]